jgi:ADP-ribosylglycohydrolase
LLPFHPNAHITDDTQLSFIKLEVLLSEGWSNPEALAERAIKERIIGIGHSAKKRMSVHELSNSIGSGAYLLETVPVTLYILAIRAYNPVLALLDAVTYTKDSDTIGAIVGYIVGALHVIRGFPGYLVKPLLREKLPRKYLGLLISSEGILKRGNVEDDGIVNGYGFESPENDDSFP